MIRSNRSGVALVFVLGILTMLLALGVTFVMSMMAESRMASTMEYQLASECAAQAGIERAVAEIKTETRPLAVAAPGQRWYYVSSDQPSLAVPGKPYSGVLSGTTRWITQRYSLRITDAASRVNVNDASPNLLNVLEGLPRLSEIVDGQTRAFWVLDGRSRLPGQRFQSKDQLLYVKGMDADVFADVQAFLTLNSYRDTGVAQGPRSPVNINTAPKEVLSAVLRPAIGDKAKADAVADQIVAWRGGANGYFDSWRKYDGFINGLSSPALSAAEKENLRDSPNPNRENTWNRSAADPVLAKTSTEFCFHSGGLYDVEATGEALDNKGTVRARTVLSAGLAMHKVLSITRKEDFALSPVFYRVTWMDSCPVDSSDDLAGGGYAAGARTVNDSVKVGFWDNFDEDSAYTQLMIKKVSGIAEAGAALQDVDASGDKEFHHTNSNPSNKAGNFADYDISHQPLSQPVDSWEFRSTYSKIWNLDDASHFADPLAGAGDVGRLRFRYFGGSNGQAYGRNEGLVYVANDSSRTGTTGNFTPGMIFEIDPPGSDMWVGGLDPQDERFDNFYLKEIDAGSFQKPFHNGVLPDATPVGGLGQDSHVPPHTKYYLKIPSAAVISDLSSGGPDGKNPPNYLYPYTNFRNEKWYRLKVFHRADDTQAVSMQIADPGGITACPTDLGGEINTWMNKRGLIGLHTHAGLASWDNWRIICPFGDYGSPVLDSGYAKGQWGSICWTRTVPGSANLNTEKITMDARSSASNAMTNPDGSAVTWTFRMPQDWTVPGLEPAYPNGQHPNETGNDLAGTTGVDQRYLQFRAYIGSTRPDSDSYFCRETPVLEDVTITFFPRARVGSAHRDGP